MSQFIYTQGRKLVPLDLVNLRRLAESEPTDLRTPSGALPPADVAAQALSQLSSGVAAFWCVPMLVVETRSGDIVGGCRFKGSPLNDRVEIGYGVAEYARRRGVATEAVSLLLQRAASSGMVRHVDAQIRPDNLAASKVVMRLGFSPRGEVTDPDGELVVQWSYQLAI